MEKPPAQGSAELADELAAPIAAYRDIRLDTHAISDQAWLRTYFRAAAAAADSFRGRGSPPYSRAARATNHERRPNPAMRTWGPYLDATRQGRPPRLFRWRAGWKDVTAHPAFRARTLVWRGC